jgi:hypothetical protein
MPTRTPKTASKAPDAAGESPEAKPAARRARQKRAIFSKVEVVPTNSLIPYHKNPRRGDLEEITLSLQENGQYKPLVVNEGSKTGRMREVLAGNHTWLAARDLGWDKIGVVWVDVDDAAAAKIVLVDNRTSDLATYDTEALAEVLRSIPDAKGTGYSESDVNAILQSIDSGDVEALGEVVNPTRALEAIEDPFDDVLNDEAGQSFDDDDMGEGIDFKHDVDDSLAGIVQLKPEMQFDFVGTWNIPQLLTNMFVEPDDLPDKLLSWAGSATKYDPVTDEPSADTWWIYNYGIDSTSGMRDISQVIMSFYCYDDYFECWWDYPDRYTTKMINSGITMAITPNFSTWTTMPRVQSLWNMYRSRWLGRYFQEAGIKVIPNLEWPLGDNDFFLDKCVLATLPKHIPVISLQVQTFHKDDQTEEKDDQSADAYHRIVDRLNPELILLYGGDHGREFWNTLGIDTPIRYVEHRMSALAEQAKNRTKKTTI